MKKLLLATALALLPAAAFSAELAHCYIGKAPSDAPVSTDKNLEGLLFSVQAANLRHACGAATDADRALIAQRIADGGCSADSQVYAFAMEVLNGPAEDARAMVLTDAGGKEGLVNRMCAAAAKCVPGTNAFDAECESTIRDAM